MNQPLSFNGVKPQIDWNEVARAKNPPRISAEDSVTITERLGREDVKVFLDLVDSCPKNLYIPLEIIHAWIFRQCGWTPPLDVFGAHCERPKHCSLPTIQNPEVEIGIIRTNSREAPLGVDPLRIKVDNLVAGADLYVGNPSSADSKGRFDWIRIPASALKADGKMTGEVWIGEPYVGQLGLKPGNILYLSQVETDSFGRTGVISEPTLARVNSKKTELFYNSPAELENLNVVGDIKTQAPSANQALINYQFVHDPDVTIPPVWPGPLKVKDYGNTMEMVVQSDGRFRFGDHNWFTEPGTLVEPLHLGSEKLERFPSVTVDQEGQFCARTPLKLNSEALLLKLSDSEKNSRVIGITSDGQATLPDFRQGAKLTASVRFDRAYNYHDVDILTNPGAVVVVRNPQTNQSAAFVADCQGRLNFHHHFGDCSALSVSVFHPDRAEGLAQSLGDRWFAQRTAVEDSFETHAQLLVGGQPTSTQNPAPVKGQMAGFKPLLTSQTCRMSWEVFRQNTSDGGQVWGFKVLGEIQNRNLDPRRVTSTAEYIAPTPEDPAHKVIIRMKVKPEIDYSIPSSQSQTNFIDGHIIGKIPPNLMNGQLRVVVLGEDGQRFVTNQKQEWQVNDRYFYFFRQSEGRPGENRAFLPGFQKVMDLCAPNWRNR